MRLASNLLVGLVALQHVAFLILEMFFWTRPLGLKIFRMTRAHAESSTVLAKNQGLYNGFLAAGLTWSLFAQDPQWGFSLKVFFLGCVIVAGIYGSLTASRSILIVQAIPAVTALFFTWMAR